MSHKPLTIAEANGRIRSLINMPISLPRNGYGSGIFFELGKLTYPTNRKEHAAGKANHLYWMGWMVNIDSGADFLDYGVCTSSKSPFDGRVINRKNGCEVFLALDS